MMTWFDLFPQFRTPSTESFVQAIAPVTSWFSPNIEVNYKGVPAIEGEIVTSVAGYGSQLGTLIDALVELAGRDGRGDGSGERGPAMQKLYELEKHIETLKAKHRDDDASRARVALAALARSDPQKLTELITEFAPQHRHERHETVRR